MEVSLVKRCTLVLFMWGMLCACAWSEEPVYFPDATLKAAVEDALWTPDPTPSNMLELTSLEYDSGWAGAPRITSLTGLEYATNLRSLSLLRNDFSDLTPLSNLRELRTLILQWNQVSTLSPLAGMTQLETLDLEANPIVNVSSLAGLSNLSWLSLHRTQVSDISPLLGLASLTTLDLRLAPLSTDSYYLYIPQLFASNPLIKITYTRRYLNPRTLTLTSSEGGSVTTPGEGQFTYELGDTIILSAEADEGFVFVNWTGNYSTSQNPATLTITQDYTIQANFTRFAQDVLYVDDDASGDASPGDPNISDPSENGTEAHPFDRIQEALDDADEVATIVVRPGTYRENIDLLGKKIHLKAVDPGDPNGGPCATLEGLGDKPTVTVSASSEDDCGLRGFIITRSSGRAAGVVCCDGASPTIVNCLIVGNRTPCSDGAVVYCKNSTAVLMNCTIADNHAGEQGAGLTLIDSNVTVLNSILWNDVAKEILPIGTSLPDVRFCTIRGGWSGVGNLDKDPLFAQPGTWVDPNDPATLLGADIAWSVWADGDYHLRSQAGRWDPTARDWLQDDVTSPCIDAGLTSVSAANEPTPNGGRINLGVYGGTAEASMSPAGQ